MINLLPIRTLHEIDIPIFGSLNVALARLGRDNIPVAEGLVVTPPDIKIFSTIFSLDFGKEEVFSQNLAIVRKEFEQLPLSEELITETVGKKNFLLNGKLIQNLPALWKELLDIWLAEIEQSLLRQGFQSPPEKWLSVQLITFVNNLQAAGTAVFNSELQDSQIKIEFGNLYPKELKQVDQLIQKANRKLFIPHEYQWILDSELKIISIKPYTPILKDDVIPNVSLNNHPPTPIKLFRQSATKVYYDYINDSTIQPDLDGIYIATERIINLNNLPDSIEDLIIKTAEISTKFADIPVLFKLPDIPEARYGIRGTIRLINQASLLRAVTEVVLFLRNKKELKNIYLVIPYVRSSEEFNQIKRELAAQKLTRKNSLELWLEINVPENLINLREYLVSGLDGVVINIDELSACLGGYDRTIAEISSYRKQTNMLISFLEDKLPLLKENKVKFLITGELSFYPEVLEFLISQGVYGIIAPKYEINSLRELFHSVEKKVLSRRSKV